MVHDTSTLRSILTPPGSDTSETRVSGPPTLGHGTTHGDRPIGDGSLLSQKELIIDAG